MDRRTLLKGIVGAGAALVLPPTLAENAESARRYWALDRTMMVPRTRTWTLHGDFVPMPDGMTREEWTIYWAMATVTGASPVERSTVEIVRRAS